MRPMPYLTVISRRTAETRLMQKLSTLSTTVLLWMFFLAPLYAQEHVTPRVRLPPDGLSREESRAVHLYREVLPTVVTILASKLVLTADGPRMARGGRRASAAECWFFQKLTC